MSDTPTDARTVPVDVIITGMVEVLSELFEEVPQPSMMLDRGDNWFDTLAGISAEEASIPAAAGISNIAASVNHATYYIDVTLGFIRGTPPAKMDWAGSWEVGAVDDAGWDALRDRLRASYGELKTVAQSAEGWLMPGAITGGISTAAHCAYHLGEVRRTLGVIRAGGVRG